MKTTTLLAALLVAGLIAPAFAQQMNYQGRLTDSAGAPRPGPQATLTFSLWTAPTAGSKVWGDFALNADLIDGRFSVKLGDASGNDGNGNLLSEVFGGARYLQLQVGADAPLPRQEILAAPSALTATTLSDGANAIALARDGRLDVPGTTSLGSGFVVTTPNILNVLPGTQSTGSLNGISFWENANFGMKLGYDGTGSGTENAIRFYGDTNAPLFTVENGGEVGIGTTTPQSALDVNGLVLMNGFTSDAGSAVNGDLDVSGTLTANLITGTLSTPSINIPDNISVGTSLTTHKVVIQSTDDNTLRLLGPGGLGSGARMNFGDGDRVYLGEPADDSLRIQGDEVGIGGDPVVGGAKLQVFGDVKLGPSAQYQAPAAEERLRMLRGAGTANIAVGGPYPPVHGSGFTYTKGAAGVCDVTFNTPFSGRPTVVANAMSNGSVFAGLEDVGGGGNPSATGFRITMFDTGGNDRAWPWNFIAVGPR